MPSVIHTGLMSTPPKTLEAYFQLNYERNLTAASFNKLWLDNNLDAILTLPAPHTAVPWDQWDVITYTALWNLLDCPAVVIPVGKVENHDLKDENLKFESVDGEDKRVYDLCKYPEHRDSLQLCMASECCSRSFSGGHVSCFCD